jgi:hypothetical protein
MLPTHLFPTMFLHAHTFALTGSLSTNSQFKQSIRKHGGTISPFISTKTRMVLIADLSDTHRLAPAAALDAFANSYAVQQAQRHGVLVVWASYINACIEAQQLLPLHDTHLLASRSGDEEAPSPHEPPCSPANQLAPSSSSNNDLQARDADHQHNTAVAIDPTLEPQALIPATISSKPAFRPRHWGLTRIFTQGAANEPAFPQHYTIVRSNVFNVGFGSEAGRVLGSAVQLMHSLSLSPVH